MWTRIAASLVSLALVSSAGARTFSQPPANAPKITQTESAPDRAAVRKALAARRDHNRAAFRAYWTAGVYPQNTERVGPLNVWRDANGHLCAAATMIDKDGKHDLVMATAKSNNHIRLLDVTDGPLLDWLMTSGLTLEEIDRIQAPMVRPPPRPEQTAQEMAAAETKRLKDGYVATDQYLIDHEKAGLDEAVARLMTNPALAKKLLAGKV